MAVGLPSTNRVKLSKVRETTFGVIPTNPRFKTIRETSSNLNANPGTQVSEEIRYDRQVASLVLVSLDASGDIGKELSFQAADDDLEEILQSTWNNNPAIVVVTPGTEISAVSATALTVASGGAAFIAGSIAVLTGLPTASNNKATVVASSTATSITFPASTFTAETATIPVGAAIRNVGQQGASGDIAAVTAGGNALTSTSLDFTTLNLVPGAWIKIGGTATATQFATAADNGFVRVSSITAHSISLDRVPSGWTADAGAGKTISLWMGDYIRNGVTQISSTFERQYTDQAVPTYEYISGLSPSKAAFTFDAQKIVTYTMTYMGAATQYLAARVAGATDIAAPTSPVLNTSSNIGGIYLNGAAVAGPSFLMSATLSIDNNLRNQNALGSLSPIGIGNGEFTVTGSISTYFGDVTIANQVVTNTATSLTFVAQNSPGQLPSKGTVLFDMPRVKYSSGAPTVEGKNRDVMIAPNYQAIMDQTLGYTVHVARYWYME